MSIKNRTLEFQRTVDSIKSRSANSRNSPAIKPNSFSKTEFSQRAGAIAQDIFRITDKLQRLGNLAKQTTFLEDQGGGEVNDLTLDIKQEIARLNNQISSLQQVSKSKLAGGNRQAREHSSNVVVQLQSRLANTSMSFRQVLEKRTEVMKSSKNRRDQFSATSSSLDLIPGSDSPLYHQQPPSSTNQNHGPLSPQAFTIDIGDEHYSQNQQLLYAENTHVDVRTNAIESIEATIQELGGIFQQLAQMVSEQRESVQRIDLNIEDMQTNVSGAQRELLKYYQHVSSNRALMLKLFAIIFVFFVIYVVWM